MGHNWSTVLSYSFVWVVLLQQYQYSTIISSTKYDMWRMFLKQKLFWYWGQCCMYFDINKYMCVCMCVCSKNNSGWLKIAIVGYSYDYGELWSAWMKLRTSNLLYCFGGWVSFTGLSATGWRVGLRGFLISAMEGGHCGMWGFPCIPNFAPALTCFNIDDLLTRSELALVWLLRKLRSLTSL